MSVLHLVTESPSQRRSPLGAGTGRSSEGARTVPLVVVASVAGAWLLVVAGELSGAAHVLHHDEVLRGIYPIWVGLGLFLAGWMVMSAAMMLPATLPVLARVGSGGAAWRTGTAGAFLAGFVAVWAAFGLAALAVDMAVHGLVEVTPVAARPSLVAAGLLGLADMVQLMPSTRRTLAASRHPRPGAALSPASAFRAGRDHGAVCLSCDGALMLVMFAAAGSLTWMALLTVVMIGERMAVAGPRLASAVGLAMLGWAGLIGLAPVSVAPPFGGLG